MVLTEAEDALTRVLRFESLRISKACMILPRSICEELQHRGG